MSKVYYFCNRFWLEQSSKEVEMATNGAKGGGRIGSVRDRTQFQQGDTWVKRDTGTGRILDRKSDDKPFKGVAKESDKRRN
jgi:hypothetical protein